MEDRERFIELVQALPLVSVDLVLVRDDREVLLGLRTNRPAQDWCGRAQQCLKCRACFSRAYALPSCWALWRPAVLRGRLCPSHRP